MQPALRLLALPLLLLALAGCDKAPTLAPLPTDAVILAFGDSLTQGTGAPADQSYPAHLARLTGRTLVNAGLAGELSAEGLARLPALLDRHQPDLLLLCHGGNDLLRKRDTDQLADNLRAMIALARERGVAVLLIGVPRPTLLLSTAPLYAALADSQNLPYEGEALARILGERQLKSDPIHPNGAGYLELAEALALRLKHLGAL